MNQSSLTKRFILPSVMYFGYIGLLWGILAYIPIYLTNLGLSHFEISILISTFPLASLALIVPFGIFSDKLPPKILVTISLVLFALFLSGLIQTEEFWSLLFFFIIGGIADSLFRISSMSLYYKTIGDADEGKKLGFYTSLGLIGYGVGPLLGGYVLTRFDMNFLVWLTLLMLIPFFIMSFFLQDVEPMKIELGDYRKDIANKEMLILVVLTLLTSLHLGVEQTSLSLFFREDIGLHEDSIGMMFFLTAIFMAILSYINGFVSDRVTGKGNSLRVLFYLGLFISGLFNIILLFTSTFGTVLVVRLLHVLGDSLILISRSVIIYNLFIQERIGGNLGVINMAITLGTFVGTVISGAIPGYILPFVVVGALSLLAIPPAISAKPKF